MNHFVDCYCSIVGSDAPDCSVASDKRAAEIAAAYSTLHCWCGSLMFLALLSICALPEC